MNLIIGDSGMVPRKPDLASRHWLCASSKTQAPSINNDPAILPFPVLISTGDSPSINDRTAEPGAATGFDLFVGRSGNGNPGNRHSEVAPRFKMP